MLQKEHGCETSRPFSKLWHTDRPTYRHGQTRSEGSFTSITYHALQPPRYCCYTKNQEYSYILKFCFILSFFFVDCDIYSTNVHIIPIGDRSKYNNEHTIVWKFILKITRLIVSVSASYVAQFLSETNEVEMRIFPPQHEREN